MIFGREAASGHESEHASFRHAKYFPVSGGFSIGRGTNNRMTGSRKNLCPRLKPSCGGNRRKPSTNGPLKTKSLRPIAITGMSCFGKIRLGVWDESIVGGG